MKSIFSLLALLLSSILTLNAKQTKPNILFFVGDDHSTFDTGCYGNKVVRTPNVDKLATQGMKFDTAFTTTSMCAPARSMLYTGLYPHRNGCHMNHGTSKAGVKSIPHYLRPLGYRVVLAGKTHIKPYKVYPFEYKKETPAEIRKVINSDQPFCLIIASHEPHAPHKYGAFDKAEIPVPPYLADIPSIRNEREGYYTDIESMDNALGKYLQILEESGKAENTITIYAGDHGSGKLAKWSCYEIGLRVPFLVRWPAKIKPASSSKAMINFVDLVPTLIEAAGGKAPQTIDGKSFLNVLTGQANTHRNLMFGAHTNQGILAGKPFPIRSVRDSRYKYIRNLNPNGIASNITTHGMDLQQNQGGWLQEWKKLAETDEFWSKRHKLILHRPAEEFYDLEKDPWELNNLADNSDYTAHKQTLSAKLDEWMIQQGDKGMASEMVTPILDEAQFETKHGYKWGEKKKQDKIQGKKQ